MRPFCFLGLFCIIMQPIEENSYADIEAALWCRLERSYCTRREDIILYGHSIGTGPTVELASRLSRFKAAVLHSPILSGLRVVCPTNDSYWFDIYNVRNINMCSIQYYHTKQKQMTLSSLSCYWVGNANIIIKNFLNMLCRMLTKFHLLIALFLSFTYVCLQAI